MKTKFPVVVENGFATMNGSFYQQREDGLWQPLSRVFMPSATGTFGEPLKTTAHRLIAKLVAKELPHASTGGLYRFEDGRMVAVKREAADIDDLI